MTSLRALLVFILALWPRLVMAYEPQSIVVNTGIDERTVPQILAGIVDILHGLAFFVTVATFLIGALYVAGSGGRENVVQNGKSIMKASLIGMAIITGSWMILSTFVSFLIAG